MASISQLNFKLFANIAPFKSGLSKAERSMDRFGRKLQQTGKKLSFKFTAPLAAVGGLAFNTFRDFEFQMSKVAAISGAVGDELEKLTQNAKDLGASTMFSASEVAQLQTEFAKLGFSASEITKVTEGTLALAQAAGAELPRAAEVAGSTLRAFGMDASETNRVTDVMAKSFSSSALDMEVFAESMKFVAPVAKSAGMSLEETSAMLAVLANAGIKGSQAGTALRRIISEVGATGKPVGQALQDLAQKGLNLADAKDEVGRNAQSTLLVLTEMVESIKPLTTSFENAKGAAKGMSNEMGDNARGATKRLQSATEGLGIAIGEIVSVAVVPLIEGMAKLAGRLNKMSAEAKRTVVVIASLVAAMGPAVFIAGGMVRNFRLLSAAIKSSNAIMKVAIVVTKAFGAAMKFAGGPMGVILALATATAGAFLLLKRRKKELTDETMKLTSGAKEQIAQQEIENTQANRMIDTIKSLNVGNEQRGRLIRDLNEKYGDLLPNLIDEKDSVEDITAAQVEMNKQMAKKIAMIALQDKMTQTVNEAVEAQKVFNETVSLSDELAQRSVASFGKVLSPEEVNQYKNALRSLSPEQAALIQDLDLNNTMLSVNKTKLDQANQAVSAMGAKVDELSAQMTVNTTSIDNNNESTGGAKEGAEELTKSLTELADEIMDATVGNEEFANSWAKISDEMRETDAEFENTDFAANLDKINDARARLQGGMMQLGQVFQQAFEAALINGDNFFATLKKAFGDLIKRILATVAAALVLAVVLSAVFGGANMAGMKMFGAGFEGGFGQLAGGIMKSMGGIPFLAEGGIVTGPTLAMIGEGRESEAVIPLSKLNTMIASGGTPQNVVVEGRISGADILLSNERAQRNRTRQRGF